MANEAGSLRLEGMNALVTGGAQGIGKAIARRFGQEGARVTIADIKGEEGLATADELRSEGLDAFYEHVDLSEVGKIEDMVGRVATRFEGRIDVLANNAGVLKDRSLLNMSEEEWRFVLGVNLRGPVFTMKEVGKHMKAAKSGSIINASSIAGPDGNFGQVAYGASKEGIVGATMSFAKEMAPYGVRVNAIQPGFVDTAMTATIPDVRRPEIVARIPLGREGIPEDIAAMYTFLASDDASYITGEVYRVDGGLVL